MLTWRLSVLDETLHASFFYHKLWFCPIGVSSFTLSTDHGPEESIFFGPTFVEICTFRCFLHTKVWFLFLFDIFFCLVISPFQLSLLFVLREERKPSLVSKNFYGGRRSVSFSRPFRDFNLVLIWLTSDHINDINVSCKESNEFAEIHLFLAR